MDSTNHSPKPDISSVEAFRSALLAARSIAYSRIGASGIYFAGLIERLGITDAVNAKAKAWDDIVKIGRTHMQDATPLTLGQEWSGYVGMLSDDLERIEAAFQGVYRLALGGTAVGTGINSVPGFAEAAGARISGQSTGRPPARRRV